MAGILVVSELAVEQHIESIFIKPGPLAGPAGGTGRCRVS
jgi:hypothetical protein